MASGSNSTKTSTSLFGPKSSLNKEPKSESLRIRWRRQKSAISLLDMGIFLSNTECASLAMPSLGDSTTETESIHSSTQYNLQVAPLKLITAMRELYLN